MTDRLDKLKAEHAAANKENDTLRAQLTAERQARTQMAGEVCYALGINAPGEDAVANWGKVLEEITARQAQRREGE